eukprot:5499510-Pleurochrysis_carterae.AAC.2
MSSLHVCRPVATESALQTRGRCFGCKVAFQCIRRASEKAGGADTPALEIVCISSNVNLVEKVRCGTKQL